MKKGFTLAEVLIAMGIIGVIAAITVPAVVNNSRMTTYVAGVKKANQTLTGALKRAMFTNGPVRNWIFTGSKDDFVKYFTPTLDIVKECGTSGTGCLADTYKTLNGTKINWDLSGYYKVTLSDGMSLAYITLNPTTEPNAHCAGDTKKICGMFYVDVNGPSGPNVFGRDLFAFDFLGGMTSIVPDIWLNDQTAGNWPSYDDATKSWSKPAAYVCTAGSSPNTAYGCAAKVIAEGAMNY